LIESNRQREKTKVQRLREYKRLKEIEAKLAAERKKATQIQNGNSLVRANLPQPDEGGRSRDKAAATADLKPRIAEKRLAVLDPACAAGRTLANLATATEWDSMVGVTICMQRPSFAASLLLLTW
jgi:hypothetical protein